MNGVESFTITNSRFVASVVNSDIHKNIAPMWNVKSVNLGPENMEYEDKVHGLKRQHTTDSDSDIKAPSRRARINPAPNLNGRRKGESSTQVADTSHPILLFLLIFIIDHKLIMELSFYLFYFLVTMTNIASLNSKGLRSSDRCQTAFSFLRRNRLDIILLQEMHWTVDLDIQIKHKWDGEVFFNHGTNTARGVAILINPCLDCIVRQIKRDNDGRILNILLEMDDYTFNMLLSDE